MNRETTSSFPQVAKALMEDRRNFRQSILANAAPLLVLAILLVYTYSKFFMHMYGFRWSSSSREISWVFVEQDPGLKVGDRLAKVGTLSYEDFHADKHKIFFAEAKPGDVVSVIVERDGQVLTIPWTYPGFNRNEFYDQFFSEWILAYFFWFAGAFGALFLRPRDTRWLLLSAFNFLTSIWLIAGSGNSSYHTLFSAFVLRMVIWLCVPVYLHLHWVFPRPLRKLPPLLIKLAYAIALGLVIAEGFQLLPQSLYLLGFILATAGSLTLIVVHYFRQPEVRRDLRFMLVVAIIAMVPSLFWGVSNTIVPADLAGLAILSLPILPFSYLYAASRRQLGGFEIRVNRFFSLFFFVMLLGTLMVPFVTLMDRLLNHLDSAIPIGIMACIVTAAICLLGYPVFQSFVEKRWLGIHLPPRHLQEVYSSRITSSTSLSALLKFLSDEVFPSLLVRQYAFVRITNSTAKVVLSENVTSDQVREEVLTELLASFRTHSRLPLWEEGQPLEWVRLILPLQMDSDLIGAWLLGRRDPDDLYPQAELPILQSLADQTAIALSNILQTEQLRKMYQDDIDRNEKSRLQLALDLHDSVLNQLAILRLNVDEAHVSPKFEKAYEEVTTRLREIVTNLRPPMLDYGLQFAVEALADNLMERSKDAVKVTSNVQVKGEARYPENIERNIFRITQEACENSIRHGHAKYINILAKLSPGSVWLLIEDDGVGFQMAGQADLDSLLAHKHFGLAGMMERAMLIGAGMKIDSYPKAGTRIQIGWTAAQDQ